MPGDFVCLVSASATRLKEARDIADALRSDERLHRLAMDTVFLLEDCHEMFLRLRNMEREGEA